MEFQARIILTKDDLKELIDGHPIRLTKSTEAIIDIEVKG